MSRLAMILLAVAVVCLLISLVGHSDQIVDGMGKALFGVAMIGFFIVQFFGETRA